MFQLSRRTVRSLIERVVTNEKVDGKVVKKLQFGNPMGIGVSVTYTVINSADTIHR